MNCERYTLVEALRQLSHDAGCILLGLAPRDRARQQAARYNGVCRRLIELDPSVAEVFRPLPAEASPGNVRLAARDVAAFAAAQPALSCS